MQRRDLVLVVLGTGAILCAWRTILRGRGATGEWPGVDESVVAGFAAASGSHARPVVEWVRGDALLFAFLVAGLVAGFVLGFFARAALRGPDGEEAA